MGKPSNMVLQAIFINVQSWAYMMFQKETMAAHWGGFVQWSLVENDVFDSAWLYILPQIGFSMQRELSKAQEDKFGVQRYNCDYIPMQVI